MDAKMKSVKCCNCLFFDCGFCRISGRFIAKERIYRKCSAYEDLELDIDGMYLTDDDEYVRDMLLSLDSEAW